MAHRAFARDDRRFPDLGPCPIRSGSPPGEAWTFLGTSPDAFDFPGAVPTIKCWLAPCPCCLQGWVALLPTGDAYRIAPIGCSVGCEPLNVALWWLWRSGELPPREPVEADEACRRYVAGAARRAARRVIEARDPVARLRREALELGSLAAGRGVDPISVARALAVAARHAGLPAEAAVAAIGTHLLAGTARPRGARP